MGNSSSSSPSELLYELPKRYKVMDILGKGGFGEVLKCRDRKTKEIVAIKIAKETDLSKEASILKVLMDNNLDQQGIIRFYSGFWMNKCLIFEALDINLQEYLRQRNAPMCLQDIRAVIQQLAKAFDALKKIGIIHTDVKTNNIMVVDRTKQPLQVKLIDFGLAVYRSSAKSTRRQQVNLYRAPEVMLDLPFSEALDIWSLGCVMAKMVFGFGLFVGSNNYDLLQHIIDLIGPPPNHLINAGQNSRLYFKKTDSNQWVLKTRNEYWGKAPCFTVNRCYTFRCLDEAKTMCLEENNKSEADERKACIELLKAMLKWDEKKRITPSEILAHPFIAMNYVSSSSDLSSSDTALESAKTESSSNQTSEDNMSQAHEVYTDQAAGPSSNQAAAPGTDTKVGPSINLPAEHDTNKAEGPSFNQVAAPDTKKAEGQGTNQATEPVTIKSPQSRNPRLIMVQPAPPQNRILLEETSDDEFIKESDSLAPTSEDPTPTATHFNIVRDANKWDYPEDGKPKRKKKKKKKKKNCIKSFFSWLKRTVCCYWNVDDVAE